MCLHILAQYKPSMNISYFDFLNCGCGYYYKEDSCPGTHLKGKWFEKGRGTWIHLTNWPINKA